jgi:hypothetical protein
LIELSLSLLFLLTQLLLLPLGTEWLAGELVFTKSKLLGLKCDLSTFNFIENGVPIVFAFLSFPLFDSVGSFKSPSNSQSSP